MIKDNNEMISKNDKAFIVAEIGANHNNNVEDIKKTIAAAKECGVDAVKFQTYTAEELVADVDRIVITGKSGSEKSQTIAQLFNDVKLDRKHHKELFDYANSLGLIVFSTPFSVDGVRFLDALGVPCFKVASSDVNYTDMLIEIAKTKKPVIISLGKCGIDDADRAIRLLEQHGCPEIIIMHCVAQYPSPMDEMNLNIISTLKSMYPDYQIGFSDHSLGITASLGAVVLGAKVIEKHFTTDKALDGPDHWFSMDPADMKSLVNEIRNMEIALGTSRKSVLPCEVQERINSTRSLVLNRSMKKGECIKESDLAMLRPGWGISPFDKEKIIGMAINQDLSDKTVLEWKYFQSNE
ncbi:hypothetical protein NFHSH190041_03810 [Shewanella sp. NFH-SH190041]|uniref:N-acetylneuraminate synthase family protein n=1 Tax=Shewanella sp. NFH-SH190041 TaxID=2950245 RepID=UPI0021C37353|nr:N-acetylneuraminate synthase family protein [Shewanella sp. NFH-SH190041]BDM62929.1 hypothetical protein NFHSH190041_03810 [Shewanella sp. NFH-SH190041]